MTPKEIEAEIIKHFIDAAKAGEDFDNKNNPRPFMGWDDTYKVEVDFDLDKVKIHLRKMYGGIENWVQFEDLVFLFKLLGTKDINLENEHYSPGCDTCDYGSSSSLDIICTNCVF